MDLRKEIICEIDEKHGQLIGRFNAENPRKARKILELACWLQTLKDEIESAGGSLK